MNAHQRRTESRRRHMALPLGKEVCLSKLRLRRVYSYRLGCDVVLFTAVLAEITSASVHRHIRPGFGGRLDIKLVDHKGSESVICTSPRGISLKNRLDLAPRPWLVETKRKHRAAARSRT
jgi:hypothetical protein